MKLSLFSKIDCKASAQRTLKATSLLLIAVAMLYVLMFWLFGFTQVLLPATLLIVLPLFLLRFKTPALAGILLAFGGFCVAQSALFHAGILEWAYSNMALALVIFFTALRSVEATLKLKTCNNEQREP